MEFFFDLAHLKDVFFPVGPTFFKIADSLTNVNKNQGIAVTLQ